MESKTNKEKIEEYSFKFLEAAIRNGSVTLGQRKLEYYAEGAVILAMALVEENDKVPNYV